MLHDCITRLKEQDIMISKLRANAPDLDELEKRNAYMEQITERNKGLERELVATQQR